MIGVIVWKQRRLLHNNQWKKNRLCVIKDWTLGAGIGNLSPSVCFSNIRFGDIFSAMNGNFVVIVGRGERERALRKNLQE